MTHQKLGSFHQGWLSGCRQVPSPNCHPRAQDQSVELVVIHNISLPPGEFGGDGVEHLFTNSLDPNAHPYFEDIAKLEVSAHFFIRRDGEVVQFVSIEDCAWHAGVSEWRGRNRCNDFSIGIELEGTDTDIYSETQYQVLEQLLVICRNALPAIDENAIVGHSDIAPGRKTDPGPSFDWRELERRLAVTGLPGI